MYPDEHRGQRSMSAGFARGLSDTLAMEPA